jgi:hypothetical protein
MGTGKTGDTRQGLQVGPVSAHKLPFATRKYADAIMRREMNSLGKDLECRWITHGIKKAGGAVWRPAGLCLKFEISRALAKSKRP